MKKFAIYLMLFCCLGVVAAYAEKNGEELDRLREAGKILNEIMSAPDKAIPGEVLESAKCVAIVPDMVKGGFVFGGKHGRGVATCRTANGWSAPAFFTLSGGSWGAQIGLEKVDVVMLITSDRGMENLLNSEFKLGAEGAVAAGPVGRDAEASTDWKLKAGVLTYSRAKGLFAGLDLNGAVLKQDKDATRAFYGGDESFRNVLTGQVTAPPEARDFLASVRQNFHDARAKSD
jgi:lipid-binding SYLF domain-containing protein